MSATRPRCPVAGCGQWRHNQQRQDNSARRGTASTPPAICSSASSMRRWLRCHRITTSVPTAATIAGYLQLATCSTRPLRQLTSLEATVVTRPEAEMANDLRLRPRYHCCNRRRRLDRQSPPPPSLPPPPPPPPAIRRAASARTLVSAATREVCGSCDSSRLMEWKR